MISDGSNHAPDDALSWDTDAKAQMESAVLY